MLSAAFFASSALTTSGRCVVTVYSRAAALTEIGDLSRKNPGLRMMGAMVPKWTSSAFHASPTAVCANCTFCRPSSRTRVQTKATLPDSASFSADPIASATLSRCSCMADSACEMLSPASAAQRRPLAMPPAVVAAGSGTFLMAYTTPPLCRTASGRPVAVASRGSMVCTHSSGR